MNLLTRFFRNLPTDVAGRTPGDPPLSDAARTRLRSRERLLATLAALLSVCGFLAYFLPVYWFPSAFPSADITVPFSGQTVKLAWGELVWGALLTAIEMLVLTGLNIVGVRDVAVETGFLTAGNASTRSADVLRIGLESQLTEVRRYGINPFQGTSTWALLAFNLLLRLKGWIGNRIIRFLTRALLVRYAARAVLDFAGLPLYMAINAYSVFRVMREAKVVMLGQSIVERLVDDQAPDVLSADERELLYDTLQYIAVSKRDFHWNHYVLTRGLLERCRIPVQEAHPLPDDFLDKLAAATPRARGICTRVILLGFILDGRLSWRERQRLRGLGAAGIVSEQVADVRRLLGDLLAGRRVGAIVQPAAGRPPAA